MNHPLPATAVPTGADDEVRLDRNLALDLVDRLHEHGRANAEDGYQREANDLFETAENLAARINLSGSAFIALDDDAAEQAREMGMI